MKPDVTNKLKSLIMQSLQQFFEQSGINQILLKLYEDASNRPIVTEKNKTVTKVENILKNNNKAINKLDAKKSKTPGAVEKLRRERQLELKSSYTDDEQGYSNTPMLNVIRESVNYTQEEDGPTVSVRQAMNESMDPLTSGVSVLDSNMPDFLMRGLSRLVNTKNK